MCTPDVPEAKTPAAAPPAPNPTAERMKMRERPTSKDGTYGKNTARSRRTLRTDLKMSGGKSGAKIARMGG